MSLAQRAVTPASRLEALKARHDVLEQELHEEQRHRFSSDTYVAQLKKLKLHVKEQIEGIHRAS